MERRGTQEPGCTHRARQQGHPPVRAARHRSGDERVQQALRACGAWLPLGTKPTTMLSKKIEAALNGQVEIEAMSSQAYLAMASWAENQGLSGTAAFLYRHSDEERQHMLK